MSSTQKRVRSPGYPAVSFKVSLKKAEEFYKVEGRNEAFQSVALTHWGYSPTSGHGLQLAAALSSYGLIDATGSGKNRKVKLSNIALKILLDDREDSSEKKQYIQSLALRPKIHQKLWNLWGPNLPSVATMKHHLIFEENFNEKSVAGFIKDYIETIEFAALDNAAQENLDRDAEDEPDGAEEEIVQVTQDRKPSSDSFPQRQRETIKTQEDDVEIGKFPVGKNCTVRLISNATVGKKAIQALVAQLELNLKLGVFDDEPDS